MSFSAIRLKGRCENHHSVFFLMRVCVFVFLFGIQSESGIHSERGIQSEYLPVGMKHNFSTKHTSFYWISAQAILRRNVVKIAKVELFNHATIRFTNQSIVFVLERSHVNWITQ